jgi:hypothetical protein
MGEGLIADRDDVGSDSVRKPWMEISQDGVSGRGNDEKAGLTQPPDCHVAR